MNFVDNYQRSGLYPNKGGWPLTLGVEAAGTIVALPTPVPENDAAYNARAFKLGQRVAVVRLSAPLLQIISHITRRRITQARTQNT